MVLKGSWWMPNGSVMGATWTPCFFNFNVLILVQRMLPKWLCCSEIGHFLLRYSGACPKNRTSDRPCLLCWFPFHWYWTSEKGHGTCTRQTALFHNDQSLVLQAKVVIFLSSQLYGSAGVIKKFTLKWYSLSISIIYNQQTKASSQCSGGSRMVPYNDNCHPV